MVKIAVNGILGRMGQEISRAVEKSDKYKLLGGIDTRQTQISPEIHVFTDAAKLLPLVDVVLDFSLPDGALQILEACRKQHKPLVTGTTGLDEEQMEKFAIVARSIPIVQTFNFSIGINLLLQMVSQAAVTPAGKS